MALLLLAAPSLPAADALVSSDAAYLKLFTGDWIMSGTFAGKPVQYRAHGEAVLQGAFIRLHMIDAAATPAYEADVTIGYDAHKNDYIVHWLDRFGAAGARVVGTGRRRGSVLTVTFPYSEGAFRDTFEWREKTQSWDLTIDSQNKDGSWSLFVRYAVVRA